MATKKKSASATPTKPKNAAEEASLLAKILVMPDEDANRLVYADWLMEHGDPRGEFIQIQCELNRPRWGTRPIVLTGPPTRVSELTAREEELLKKHSKEWLAPVRPFLRVWNWLRGFLHQIHVNASFFDGSVEVLTRHPIGALCFEGLKAGDIARFGTTEFPHLRKLDVTTAPITEKNISAFLGKNLAHLETLVFHGARLRGSGLVQLATESHFRMLKKLHLSSCWVDDEGFRALTSSPVLGNLEWLDVSSNEVTSVAAMTLVESKALPKLKTVRVDDTFANMAGEATMNAYRERFEIIST